MNIILYMSDLFLNNYLYLIFYVTVRIVIIKIL